MVNQRQRQWLLDLSLIASFAIALLAVAVLGVWILLPAILDLDMVRKLAVALGPPIVLFAIFLVIHLRRRESPVRPDSVEAKTRDCPSSRPYKATGI
jgi:hypothetical protein